MSRFNTLALKAEQIDAARAVMAEAIAIGSEGTQGDYTDSGLLYKMFEALDADVKMRT